MLQEACEILRRTLRFLYYARRLKEQLRGGTREIPKVNVYRQSGLMNVLARLLIL